MFFHYCWLSEWMQILQFVEEGRRAFLTHTLHEPTDQGGRGLRTWPPGGRCTCSLINIKCPWLSAAVNLSNDSKTVRLFSLSVRRGKDGIFFPLAVMLKSDSLLSSGNHAVSRSVCKTDSYNSLYFSSGDWPLLQDPSPRTTSVKGGSLDTKSQDTLRVCLWPLVAWPGVS